MKRKITAIALVVALLAIGIVGGTLAFFQDTKTAANTFTFGKGVYVNLSESSTESAGVLKGTEKSDKSGYEFKNVQPGLVYSKVPVVKVDEKSNDCWLAATVTVNRRALLYEIYKNDATVNHTTWLSLAGKAALVTGGISDYTVYAGNYNGFSCTKLNDGTKDVAYVVYTENNSKDTITFTYFFVGEQAAEKSYTLFDEVKIPEGLTQDMLGTGETATTNFDITVKAYAVQADGFTDAYDAFTTAFAQDAKDVGILPTT